MVLTTCHKVLFGASWLLQLLIQVATPPMTACNEPEGIVDQSGAWWKKSPRGRRKFYLPLFSVGPKSLRGSAALYFDRVCTLCKLMFISPPCELFYFIFFGSSFIQTVSLNWHHATTETDDTSAVSWWPCRRQTQRLPSSPQERQN